MQAASAEGFPTTACPDFPIFSYLCGYVPEGGMELDGIMPPLNPFDPSANRMGKIEAVVARLKAFFNKFFPIANGEFAEGSES